ncbi:hypothetical protein CANINC_004908 [Pichia inconspicua]|uniref:Intimal thickness related receptor IRP domain-containing protein n=1 Tax=Pichia inconspicua TaxID=52247 RepID=A0A4T0WWE4_9ASCO|nr:hypothetical protein CANINC_004908 [[Candida] inconspicua]
MIPKKYFSILLWLFTFATAAFAQKIKLTAHSAEYCTGMYSKVDWGGPVEPFIKVDLKKYEAANPETGNASLSIVIFEYQDIDALGVVTESGQKRYVCDETLVSQGLCDSSQLYQFIVDKDASTYAPIKTTVLTDLGTNDFSYIVANTGYYCIAAINPPFNGESNNFDLIVNFHNAFGNLPASQIPLLSLYGLLAVVYAVCLCVYLFPVFKHRAELLLLQKYLAGFFVFLTVEDILTWSLYEIRNNNKKYPLPAGIQFYTVVISILNAFKISFSLFLLLIISLGYGIVHLKLPRRLMNVCKIVCGTHFILSAVVAWLSYHTSQTQPTASTTDTSRATDSFDADSWILLGFSVPLIGLFMGIYVWILSSLRNTTQNLLENKQVVKLKMYQKLFRLIFASVLLLIFGFVISNILIFNDNLTESIERFWKINDVLITFWPSCVYFIVFMGIAIIYRPTDTSYLLAASTQVPTSASSAIPNAAAMDLEQYENDFEFDDLRSLESNNNANPFEQPKTHQKSSDNPFDDTNQLEDPFDDGQADLDEQLKQERAKSRSNNDFQLEEEEEGEDDTEPGIDKVSKLDKKD